MTINRLFSRDFKIEYLSNNLDLFFFNFKFKQRYTSVHKPIQIQKINLYNIVELKILVSPYFYSFF